MYFGLAVAVAYFFSASQVFPKETGDWKSLDEHYWARKRYVLPGIIFANLAVISQRAIFRGQSFHEDFFYGQFFYWIPIIALLFTRKRWIDVALLVELCLTYLVGAMMLGW